MINNLSLRKGGRPRTAHVKGGQGEGRLGFRMVFRKRYSGSTGNVGSLVLIK